MVYFYFSYVDPWGVQPRPLQDLVVFVVVTATIVVARSEERRVGKECRSRWSPDPEKKKDADSHLDFAAGIDVYVVDAAAADAKTGAADPDSVAVRTSIATPSAANLDIFFFKQKTAYEGET